MNRRRLKLWSPKQGSHRNCLLLPNMLCDALSCLWMNVCTFRCSHWINQSLVNLSMCFWRWVSETYPSFTDSVLCILGVRSTHWLRVHSSLSYSGHFVRILLRYRFLVPGKAQGESVRFSWQRPYSATLSPQGSLSTAFLHWSISIWGCKRTLNSFLWTENRARKDYKKSPCW